MKNSKFIFETSGLHCFVRVLLFLACYVINHKIILSLIKHSLGYTEGFQQFLKQVAKVYEVMFLNI